MNNSLPNHVREMLEKSGALLTGHFILTSGRHSGNYMQCAKICAHPEFCEALAKELAAKIKAKLGAVPCDLVLAPALGGVVFGYELARQMGVPGLFTERDKEGIMRLRRGFELAPGQRILIAEDVVTTGGSVLEVAKIVGESGASVGGYACLFDRSAGSFHPGPPVFSIAQVTFPTYASGGCPLCREGKLEPVKPGSRK
ncbi:orotate phosphoribosyltransferase [Candidatus Sumerlaeota bacterium]|nr:orotate phosphoribosyltransferase [Candidatus Sumerlaeota bacterium]MBI3736687.1 orotate phosphoribosyltransferase [Candidatus Sumerlaeota bacterium]